jgi:DNA-binding MarR family transcriptional regulator
MENKKNIRSEKLVLVDALVQMSFQIQAVLSRLAADHDLSIIQLRLLGVLRDRTPGMLDLARHLNLDKSSITGLVDRAERRGLVQRNTTPEDGRAIRVSITPHGLQIASEITNQIEREINLLVTDLNDAERNHLVALLSQIIS